MAQTTGQGEERPPRTTSSALPRHTDYSMLDGAGRSRTTWRAKHRPALAIDRLHVRRLQVLRGRQGGRHQKPIIGVGGLHDAGHLALRQRPVSSGR